MSLLEPLRAFLKPRSLQTYLVGGAVRDTLLARETHDLDLTVQGSASALARAFADDIGASYFLMDEFFDVARVILDTDGEREIVDFARLRGETIERDLATRDFTINAMAVDIATWGGGLEGVIDPYRGLDDVQHRRVRAVTQDVFKQDAVRLMRAARLEAELDFVLDTETEGWVRRDAARLEGAPMERVRDEFVKLIAAPNLLRHLNRLENLDLMGRVLPEVNAMRGVTQSPPHIYDVFEHTLHAAAAAQEMEKAGYLNLAQGAFGTQLRHHFAQPTAGGRKRSELLRLALLLHDSGKPATRSVDEDGRIRFLGHEMVGQSLLETAFRRLKLSNEEIALGKLIVQNHMRPLLLAAGGLSDRVIYRFFRDTGEAGVDVLVHAWCDQAATYAPGMVSDEQNALHAVLARLLDRYYHARDKVVLPPALVTGADVLEILQLDPGPRVGAALEAVREAQAMGEIVSREEAIEFLKKFDPPA
ncbi:MAG: HD domain-containing protein [Anaerolineae bacterium]|nr:HD domain-containing protein [Anaerolineae bacterium]